MHFRDRDEAGRRLAAKVAGHISRRDNLIVYALPRGGVVVAQHVAGTIFAPLDLLVVRKVGHPQNPGFAIAAVSEDGTVVENHRFTQTFPAPMMRELELAHLGVARELRVRYCGTNRRRRCTDHTAVIVDDGIATGLTIRAAIACLRKEHPRKIIVASPIAPREFVDSAPGVEIITLDIMDASSPSVSSYYDEFHQVSDEEVIDTLESFNEDWALANAHLHPDTPDLSG